jgi:toxin CcdB
MAQFDVLRTKTGAGYPLVVDMQADLHARLITRIVVPMMQRSRYTVPATRLTPIVSVRNVDYVALFPLLAAVPQASLGETVGSLAAQRGALIAALDLLVTGS